MLVNERMTHNPITVREDTSLYDALKIMRDNKVRRLPVLGKEGSLVGIVSEKDLLYASPSPATTLSVWEINYLTSKITVSDLMTKEVITICEDCPMEEAARIMVDSKIGGLPGSSMRQRSVPSLRSSALRNQRSRCGATPRPP